MDTFAIVAFSFSTFGLIGFVFAANATEKLKELEKELTIVKQRLDEVAPAS